MNPLGLLHAWMLAFMLASVLTGAVLIPAGPLGFRVRTRDAVEAVCWVALGFVLMAELVAAA